MLLLLAGCNASHLDIIDVAALDDAVLVLDRAIPDHAGLLRIVRIDATSTTSADVALGEGDPSLLARPGSPTERLVLTEGRLGDAQHAPLPSQLVRVDRTGELGRWTFQGQYTAARSSRDGRYVVALTPRGRLVVENRVEVVDLTMPAGTANPLALSLRSLGGEVPVAAELSGTIAWSDGHDLRVAALFAAGQLSLFDLDAPDETPVTIPTTTAATSVSAAPVEGFFVGSEIVVRSSGTQLLIVALVPSTGTRRFDVAVRTLAASGSIVSLAIDARGPSPRVLALTTSTLDVFDLETGMSTSVPMSASYAELLLFDGPAPSDPTSRPRVAVFGVAHSITFVDFGARPTDVLGSFVLPLSFQPDAVVADSTAGRLVVFQDLGRGTLDLDVAASFGRRPVSVVNLFDRSALALQASSDLSRAVVSTNLREVWVAGTDGYVNRFDLMTEQQEERWLDRPAQTLLPLLGNAQRVLALTDVYHGAFAILEAGVAPRPITNAW
jgi:hypothetical protein